MSGEIIDSKEPSEFLKQTLGATGLELAQRAVREEDTNAQFGIPSIISILPEGGQQ